jgi:hypothetical protein
MKPKNNISMFETLKALSSEQRAAATNPSHTINDRLRESLKEEDELLRMIKKRAELEAMSVEELEAYEQSLLALWTPRIALENQIDRLSTERTGQLEIFNKLKNPDAPENSRLKDSILSLKYKIEDLEGKLDRLTQENT